MAKMKKEIYIPGYSPPPEVKESCHCTMCGTSSAYKFYESTNERNKFNHKLSLCKPCISYYYNYYKTKYVDNYKSMFYLCRKLDIPYIPSYMDASIKRERSKDIEIWQSYFAKFNSLGGKHNYGTCFDDGIQSLETQENIEDGFAITHEIRSKWGFGRKIDDYQFLENEYAKWEKTTKTDNQSQEFGIREMCMLILDLAKAREAKQQNTKELTEQIIKWMVTLGLDAKSRAAIDTSDSQVCFGNWIKSIESNRPAEVYDQSKLYEDYCNMKPLMQNYVERPIRNYITGNRDFNVHEDGEE